MALKPGERIRCYEGAALCLPSGATALEVSATFQPKNHAIEEPSVIRLPAVSRRARATMFRDPALSVELWRLPERSLIDPDGETCHVMVALTPGVVIDGRHLTQGEAIFVPAWGRPFQVQATHGQVLVAYPDAAPTTIWRDAPGPDPAAGQAPRPEPVRPPLSAVARHDVLAA
ncbi:MAG: hypothetical protein GC155_07295 [Alphaproteobacteria bacterium]|nr:hypothetical protein [Alphaproteobacteria bacterium]